MAMLQPEVNENMQPAIQTVPQQIQQYVPAQSKADSSQDISNMSANVPEQKSAVHVPEKDQEQDKPRKKKQIAKIKPIKKRKNRVSIYSFHLISHQIIIRMQI